MLASTSLTRAGTIARLNDRCRLGHDRTARTLITRNCLATIAGGSTAEGLLAQARLLKAIRRHRFADDDRGPHDRGKVEFDGLDVFFAIDAYDLALEYGSEDPADASVTIRVMTIMLREDN